MSESFSWWKKRENWHEHSPWVTLQEKCPSQLKFDNFSRWPPANRCPQLIAPPPMGHVTQRRAQNNLRGVLYKFPKGRPIWTQAGPSVGLLVSPPLVPEKWMQINGESVKHCSSAPHGLGESSLDSKWHLTAYLQRLKRPSDSDFWETSGIPMMTRLLHHIYTGSHGRVGGLTALPP